MTIEVKVPTLGESIYEVQIVRWLKREGDWVDKDEDLVEIDTDKATLQIPAPVAGALTRIAKQEDQLANVGEVIAYLDESQMPTTDRRDGEPREAIAPSEDASTPEAALTDRPPTVMPAAERLLAEYGLEAGQVTATGPGGRLLKEDVLRFVEQEGLKPGREPQPEPTGQRITRIGMESTVTPARQEEVVPMSMIRRRIAQRLVDAQQTAALLTTVNEIDMSAVIELRHKYRELFQEKYRVKLGFMSFFVKAVIEGLKLFPQLNAEMRDQNIVYRNYYDIGIAIGGGRGLVVPVLRNAERMSFAEIEQTIGELAKRAEANKLTPEELEGGTFTITNGGVYGSLLSTPLVNPPQSGILGLHVIQDRPVACEGQVVIRPMMYVALTYDHRIVDGREAVGVLRRVKDIVEEPPRMLLEI
jgi:2-oxoglutarate dehydrogenase E2 component (dihydrolipoamide succinyltransferase)